MNEEKNFPQKINQNYKEKIHDIICSLPKSKIRKFPYITQLPNSKHQKAYDNICNIIQEEIYEKIAKKNSELEQKLNNLQQKYDSHWDLLARTMPDKQLKEEIKNREKQTITKTFKNSKKSINLWEK